MRGKRLTQCCWGFRDYAGNEVGKQTERNVKGDRKHAVGQNDRQRNKGDNGDLAWGRMEKRAE